MRAENCASLADDRFCPVHTYILVVYLDYVHTYLCSRYIPSTAASEMLLSIATLARLSACMEAAGHRSFLGGVFEQTVPYYLAKWNLRGTILCYIISPIFAAPIPYRIKNWDIWYQKPRTFCMRNWYFLPLIARNPTYLATCNPFVVITKDLKDSQFSGGDGH